MNRRKTLSLSVVFLCILISTIAVSLTTRRIAASPLIPPREKTFVIANRFKLADPTSLNPLVGAWMTPRYGLIHGVYEILFLTNHMTGEIIPWLATGYNYTEGFNSVIVSLRNDVKWSDGQPFTADDVVFTFEMHIENAPTLSGSSAIAGIVAEVKKLDDYTVEFVMKSPDPRWLPSCATVGTGTFILPKHIWEGEDPLTFKNDPPIGTGPYVLVEKSEVRSLYKYNDDYWGWDAFGVRPAPEYLENRFSMPVDIHTMHLARGELDIGGFVSGFTVDGVFELIKTNPFLIQWSNTPPHTMNDICPRYLSFNVLKYPWNIPEVRWAIAYAIDPSKTITAYYGGPYSIPADGVIFSVELLRPDYREVYDRIHNKYDASVYNTTKAIETLEDLGFTRGTDGIFVTPNGTRLAPEVLAPSPRDAEAEAIVSDLQAAGIDATYRMVNWSPTFQTMVNEGDYELAWAFICGSTIDPFQSLDRFNSKNWRPIGTSTAYSYNSERWKNSTFDAIMNEWISLSPDDPRSLELFEEAYTIWMQELVGAPLYESRGVAVMNTKYWVNWPTEENPYIQIPWWWSSIQKVMSGYQSPETGDWVGGIRPRSVDMTTAFMIEDVPKFRGIDQIWYGPFISGDSVRIPVDDAELLIRKGLASYTGISGLENLAEDLAETKSEIAALNAQMNNNTIILVVVNIAILATIFIVRKK